MRKGNSRFPGLLFSRHPSKRHLIEFSINDAYGFRIVELWIREIKAVVLEVVLQFFKIPKVMEREYQRVAAEDIEKTGF